MPTETGPRALAPPPDTPAAVVHTSVLVIGAGPAGLAVAGALAQRGVQARLIDKADSVAASWKGHYRRLHLHTVKQLSALPHLPFPQDAPRYVPRQQVVDYLESYARHFGIAPAFGEEASAITREGSRWRTVCSSGRRFVSDHVVVATGANGIPNRPGFPGEGEYRGRVLHSRLYQEPAPFAGQRVLVVGLGNTGAEIALDLAENGVQVAVSVRSPVNLVHRDIFGRPTQQTAILISRLPPRLGDAIARWLRDITVGDLSRWGLQTPAMSPLRQLREHGRTPVIDVGTLAAIRAGRIAVRPGIDAFTADGVRFTDGRQAPYDAVILATGYRPDVRRLFPAAQVSLGIKDTPTGVVGHGPLEGVFFVGFDVRQSGGMLRSIAIQAEQVAQAIGHSIRTAS